MYLSIFGIMLCACRSSDEWGVTRSAGQNTMQHGQEIDQWLALDLVVPCMASRDVFGL